MEESRAADYGETAAGEGSMKLYLVKVRVFNCTDIKYYSYVVKASSAASASWAIDNEFNPVYAVEEIAPAEHFKVGK